jgi:hypothetical protein
LINFSFSKTNLLQIKDKTELMRRKDVSKYDGSRLAIDWIHNLVYYNEDKQILVFNMTDTRYEFVVIQEEEEYMNDIKVNPLNSILFYCTRLSNGTHTKGRIMKASQDGSNRTVITHQYISIPSVLTIDLVLRKVIWIGIYLNTFSSIDFEGNKFSTFGTYKSNSFIAFMEIYNDYIYWTKYWEKSLFKSENGVNDTQINYLITLKNNEIGPFKIIDSSLQPNSTNRCINHKCSHICIPISITEYRCICPQFSLQNDTKTCTQSVRIYNRNILNVFSNKHFVRFFHTLKISV